MNITLQDTGCWFDSARGQYIGLDVINLAESYGYNIPPQDEIHTTPDGECYHELWNEAEEYIQQFVPKGCYFGSNESGDWGLWKEEKK